ncbi:uncharacterized protein B0I36DRAFT_328130 [Microdochium trichocladiopsis]|uniref:Secreted protein n=1 Tax=Microdochium trichocladiopsis TaxID=1682393 RepID=A0A9P8Y296_9PEZI|nr:uncharacterized protein B0I36DRAFT_328130 [Microdochium trichocladiopsis]KAH7027887.1 hypothetical protein B0I36DRAFT_328130 [Microdochium trichocladiopsis]
MARNLCNVLFILLSLVYRLESQYIKSSTATRNSFARPDSHTPKAFGCAMRLLVSVSPGRRGNAVMQSCLRSREQGGQKSNYLLQQRSMKTVSDCMLVDPSVVPDLQHEANSCWYDSYLSKYKN